MYRRQSFAEKFPQHVVLPATELHGPDRQQAYHGAVTSSVKECWRGGYIIHARQAQPNLTIHISSASCEDSVANLPSVSRAPIHF